MDQSKLKEIVIFMINMIRFQDVASNASFVIKNIWNEWCGDVIFFQGGSVPSSNVQTELVSIGRWLAVQDTVVKMAQMILLFVVSFKLSACQVHH